MRRSERDFDNGAPAERYAAPSLSRPKDDRSTSGITVFEDFDHTEHGRRWLGHRAACAVSVRMTDPYLIGRLMTRATEELEARIDGPW